jgi:hypothetical protein
MTAAFWRGDLDETARQGQLAGPAVVERALAARDRTTQLAGIVAAEVVDDRVELLPALARLAGGPDRRTAIPAARAARDIARELADRWLPDDLAPDDLAGWRAVWADLAMHRDRWIELRVLALDVTAALAAPDLGFELTAALADPDPAFRDEAVALVPAPVPVAMRAALATVVADDRDPDVALAAAQVLCTDLAGDPPEPVLAALGATGLARIRTLVVLPHATRAAVAAAARCLAADPSPQSAAVVRGPRRHSTMTRSLPPRPNVSGIYISSAFGGGTTKLPGVVARAT